MIAIIKYNAGNSQSVQNALKRLGFKSIITKDLQKIKDADYLIFPGVGEASTAMKYLRETGLDKIIINLKQPFLGICLGMQLMCQYSEEGETPCLNIFNTDVKRFPAKDVIPHTGWNNFEKLRGPLFKSVNVKDHVYYTHSYYVGHCHESVATCNYILPFCASLQRDNFYGVQFHPEKSGEVGKIILKNFLNL